MIGCDCAVCRSDDPRNKRRRVSLLVEHQGTAILVDSSPDLRLQMLDAGIRRLDAVLYTHGHADHVHGLDDLRAINYHMNSALDAYGTAETLESIRQRFPYAFGHPRNYWQRPSLTPRPIAAAATFQIGAITVQAFRQGHGRGMTTGYRFGPAAYSTDTDALDQKAFACLEGVALWVVDCLGYQPHPTHAHLARTLEWVERVRPTCAVLTHMSHQFDYASLAAELPAGIVPGVDGLRSDAEAIK
jgi:phosphoribosyl 1,2-cyclic phosphate phosphodiesterase